MRKALLILGTAAAFAVTAVAAPNPAEARSRGGAVAAGVIGGIALGALAGSALAAPGYYAPAPHYYAPPPRPRRHYAPAPVYYGPQCHWQRQRIFDGYRWYSRPVQVCY